MQKSRHPLFVLLVAALSSACGVGAPHATLDQGLVDCGPSGDRVLDEEVFAKLTEEAWYHDGGAVACGGAGAYCAGTSYYLRLQDDGEYSESVWSDYPESDDRGTWSFGAITVDEGVICMRPSEGEPSVTEYRILEDGNLQLGGRTADHTPISP